MSIFWHKGVRALSAEGERVADRQTGGFQTTTCFAFLPTSLQDIHSHRSQQATRSMLPVTSASA